MKLITSVLALALFAIDCRAGEVVPPVKKGPGPSRVEKMDFGAFISASIGKVKAPADRKAQLDEKMFGTKDGLAVKGIVVKVGSESKAAVCFDTDLLRYAAGWTGGFVDFGNTNTGQYKGNEPAIAVGVIEFGTKPGPGVGINGNFADTRKGGVGPLPEEVGQYRGLYVHGGHVIFSYSVGDAEVLETPAKLEFANAVPFARSFKVGASKKKISFVLCEKVEGAAATLSVKDPNLLLETVAGRLVVTVAPRENALEFTAAIYHGQPEGFAPPFPDFKAPDFAALTQGGPARWAQTIEVQGSVGANDGPYVIDTIAIPESNPWNSWFRPTGFDFFADGTRAAVCTLSGDVWTVSGIDASLKKLTWKRVAAGLYEPLGLAIVNDEIYVQGRDQITKLVDLNGDSEADFYSNFCSKWNVSPSYHAFSFDLWTDKEGNFYFVNDSNQVEIGLPGHGVVFKISKDGKKVEEIANGLRAPNGMAVGPNGEIVCSDNHGFWMPSSKINWVKRGQFLGFPGDPRKQTATQKYVVPPSFDQPLCWIPYAVDSSSGGQAFITSDKWGPFAGKLVHLSYGKCTLHLVTTENVGGVMQGGTVRMGLTFPSGVMRARFHAGDGQLYVCGMKGWQTSAVKDGCFSRVRYTGAPVRMPMQVKTHPRGIDITFTAPLDEASAKDVSNYAIEQWNYSWSPAYGSPDFKVSNPKEKGRDSLDVEYVNLSADKRTVSIALKKVEPVMQMGIKVRLKAADGEAINTEVNYTINKVGQ